MTTFAPVEVVDAFDFRGRVVVVTGGTRGIGRSVVQRFLACGADVVATGRNHVADEGLPDAVDGAGERRRAVGWFGDLREAAAASELVDAATGRFGRLDVLVNNAGGSPKVDAADASPRFTNSVVALNLLAPLYCATAANRVMQGQSTGGSVVNVASVSGLRPSPGTAAYGAAKAGLVSLTQSLALEWAPRVRVNAVTAGMVATEASTDHYGGPEGLAEVGKTVPIGRMARPEEIADCCLFLASSMASYVTGSNLVAHGGGERPGFLVALERLAEAADG
ncbi:MAG: SDR family oxidoreductase [Acidimicrobiales bacterium]|nr:SDR family oxidoreductase [Acidimicrobiales bacterium]